MSADTSLTIEHHRTPQGHHLTLAGDLDYTNSVDLETSLTALPLSEGDVLTLDLAGLSFCDSTGLSTLITAQRLLAQAGGRVSVTAIDRNLARVMTITGIDHLFGVAADTPTTSGAQEA
ncbi:STAS domain-containing protein [Actinokineospora sp. PR83]|uniref:STAS domain-containing protein n=1 Tax=Actinokineospora sp. PR83 TaxID=2884908 RepID=UPI0027E1B264|nr:STAS domain-containing protein [Actinokineospora sp. PR83]MCG8920791.1 STAS domain-containing protein [Actinokineospora sp. PR83]